MCDIYFKKNVFTSGGKTNIIDEVKITCCAFVKRNKKNFIFVHSCTKCFICTAIKANLRLTGLRFTVIINNCNVPGRLDCSGTTNSRKTLP